MDILALVYLVAGRDISTLPALMLSPVDFVAGWVIVTSNCFIACDRDALDDILD